MKCRIYPARRDFYWAAGIFEGEGTVTIGRTLRKLATGEITTYYRLICIVGNTDKSIINFFDQHWPGWVQPVYGERPGRKPAWTWAVAGPAASDFVREIFLYIRTNRVNEKMLVAIKFRSLQTQSKHKQREAKYKINQTKLFLKMKKMNQRGLVS